MNLQSELIKYSKRQKLFSAGDKILVAVSGGVDSVVLLYLLYKISPKLKFEIYIAHFNHQLRGEESDGDESFVKNLANELSFPYFAGSKNVAAFAKTTKQSIEMAARECRYNYLQEVANKIGANLIATGHNADDQAETILQHFLRGSGVAGLVGIKPQINNIIRPLLFATRQDIKNYAQKNKIPFREDSTNRLTIYQRNQIRHELLPHLENNYNPSLTKALNRMGENFLELENYLIEQSQNALETCIKQQDSTKIILDISEFFTYFSLLQKYVLKAALKKIHLDPGLLDFEKLAQINALLQKKQSGGKIKLNNTVDFVVSSDEIYIGPPDQDIPPLRIKTVPGYYDLGSGWIIEIFKEPLPSSSVLKNSSSFEEWIDQEKVAGDMLVRSTRDGDSFFPINFNGSKKVSDLLIDSKIPVYARKQIPIVECDNGIIWIGGMRLDDRFKITNSTKNILHLQLRKAD